MVTSDMQSGAQGKLSFRQRTHLARENAIIESVNRLLSEKGYEAMTVDEVAADVGIAKTSLYRHFPSKEDLAAAAMLRVMERAIAFLDGLDATQPPLALLQAVTRWTLERQLQGEMPSLPSHNSSLVMALLAHQDYTSRLLEISERLGAWIEAAQADGSLNPALPAIAVLYTIYARACDPVLGFLKATGQFTPEQIIDIVAGICFDGVRHAAAA